MAIVISLRQVVSELSMISDDYTGYLNRHTGELLGIAQEELRAAESSKPVDAYPEWQRELIKQAEEVPESDDYIMLPSKWDIHEYEIMRQFYFSLDNADDSEGLLDTIRGSGAFRRFKHKIRDRGLEEAWYLFRDRTFADIAVEWLEENGLTYVRDIGTESV